MDAGLGELDSEPQRGRLARREVVEVATHDDVPGAALSSEQLWCTYEVHAWCQGERERHVGQELHGRRALRRHVGRESVQVNGRLAKERVGPHRTLGDGFFVRAKGRPPTASATMTTISS